MALVIDKIAGPLIHNHRDKLSLSGGTMTGTLEFPTSGFIMNSGTKRFYITIDGSGALIATEIGSIGTPIGLLLSLTYAS